MVGRAITEARNPATWPVSAIVEKWNWVSDTETCKAHATAPRSPAAPQPHDRVR
jgi:hypothetical protein